MKKARKGVIIGEREVKEVVGKTWFDFEETENFIVFDTRLNGDVGGETPGKEDVLEGRRLVKEVLRHFPKHDVKMEVVDEWVHVEIKRIPKSPTLLREEAFARKTKALSEKWATPIKNALLESSKVLLGDSSESKNHARPFRWGGKVIPGDGGTGATTFVSKYGKRYLYRDHLEAIPPFETPEDGRKAIRAVLDAVGGTLKGERVREPYKTLTYNYPAPRNVIEEVGEVVYDVELPRTVPDRARDIQMLGLALPRGKSMQESRSRAKGDGNLR
jgi:hypothetical protein